MPRRHMKKDDNTACGLPLNAKFQKNLAADRHTVTCGACELATRPRVERPPPAKTEGQWEGAEGEVEGEEAGMAHSEPRAHE